MDFSPLPKKKEMGVCLLKEKVLYSLLLKAGSCICLLLFRASLEGNEKKLKCFSPVRENFLSTVQAEIIILFEINKKITFGLCFFYQQLHPSIYLSMAEIT